MSLKVFNTRITYSPYTKGEFPIIEEMYTSISEFAGETECPLYVIDNEILYLPRGTPIGWLENIVGEKAEYIDECDPYEKMTYNHELLVDPRDEIQKDSLNFLKESNNPQKALNISTGFGKAEPISRKIPTPDGYKLMGDLKVGDKIFGSNGDIITVTETFDQGIQDIYKITFSDGRIAMCCKEHLWNVKTYANSEYETKSLKEIMSDYRTHSRNVKSEIDNNSVVRHYVYKYRIPVVTSAIKYNKQEVPIDPYTLGAFFISSECLAPLPEVIELIGLELRDRKIPDVYMYNDYDVRVNLLKGIMSTNGNIKIYSGGKYEITYSAYSKILLEQIIEILQSLGFNGSIVVNNQQEFHGTLFFKISNDFKAELFDDHGKLLMVMRTNKYTSYGEPLDSIEIRNIELSHREEARCIKVSSDDQLYVTENYIVTHNTFCVAYNSTQDMNRTIIITPNDSLKRQWINTYVDMFNYPKYCLMPISGSNDIVDLMKDTEVNADVYFVNHQSLRNYLTRYGPNALTDFFKRIKVGKKVYDEAHLEFTNILLIDYFSNTKETIYLSATYDRSNRSESRCFKQAFSKVDAFGEQESLNNMRKHVIYHKFNINSFISSRDRAKLISFQGMTVNSYGNYAYYIDKKKTIQNAIVTILKKLKDVEGKVLIFVPLINAADDTVKFIQEHLPELNVTAYHSKVNKKLKSKIYESDVIVSTVRSSGTGLDIKNLRTIILGEPFASRVTAKQVLGRLRPYSDDKDTFYFDIVDTSIAPIGWWYNARFKGIEDRIKDYVILNE